MPTQGGCAAVQVTFTAIWRGKRDIGCRCAAGDRSIEGTPRVNFLVGWQGHGSSSDSSVQRRTIAFSKSLKTDALPACELRRAATIDPGVDQCVWHECTGRHCRRSADLLKRHLELLSPRNRGSSSSSALLHPEVTPPAAATLRWSATDAVLPGDEKARLSI